jgi:outer membrane biosynthesis protein TonB
MEIGGEPVIDNWWLKGCSGSSGSHYFEKNVSQYIDVWWYEYTGWACNTLYWDIDGFNIVPASAFTQNKVKPEVRPTPTPTVEPTPDPTVEPTPTPTPSVTPEEPPIILPTVPESPPAKPTPETTLEPTPSEIPFEPPVMDPPTPEEIVAQLWEKAQEDDIVVPEELSSIPVIGLVVQGLADVANFIGNVGSDMTPEVRVKAQKTVVAAVVVGQIAQTAAMAAAIRKVK